MPAALAGDSVAAPDVAPTATAEEHLNAAVGCKTNQVALALLAQIMQLEHENLPAASEEQLDKGMLSATAMVAEKREPAGRSPKGVSVRRENARADDVSGAGHEERPVSHARRQEHGPADT
jgi:hypothetical protein